MKQSDSELLEILKKTCKTAVCLPIKDGDILILRHPGRLTQDAIKNTKKGVSDFFQSAKLNVRVLLLEEDMTIDSVLSREEKCGNS